MVGVEVSNVENGKASSRIAFISLCVLTLQTNKFDLDSFNDLSPAAFALVCLHSLAASCVFAVAVPAELPFFGERAASTWVLGDFEGAQT